MDKINFDLGKVIKAESMDKSRTCKVSHVRVVKFADPSKRRETRLYEGSFFGTL